MFDKMKYWERRSAGLRGQATVESKRYPKGAAVTYTTREKEKAEFPNALGSYFQGMNRVQARKRLTDRDPTKPNYDYRTHREKAPFKGHKLNAPTQQLPYPPSETNHQRMVERALARNG